MGEMVERVGEALLPDQCAELGRLAVDEEHVREAGSRRIASARCDVASAACERVTAMPLRGLCDRVGEQGRAGRCRPPRLCDSSIGEVPAGDRAGNGDRRVGAARRDAVIALVAIGRDRRLRTGAAAGLDIARRPCRARGSARSRRRRWHSYADRRRRWSRRRRSSPRSRCRPARRISAPASAAALMRRHDHALFADDRFAHALAPWLPHPA